MIPPNSCSVYVQFHVLDVFSVRDEDELGNVYEYDPVFTLTVFHVQSDKMMIAKWFRIVWAHIHGTFGRFSQTQYTSYQRELVEQFLAIARKFFFEGDDFAVFHEDGGHFFHYVWGCEEQTSYDALKI